MMGSNGVYNLMLFRGDRVAVDCHLNISIGQNFLVEMERQCGYVTISTPSKHRTSCIEKDTGHSLNDTCPERATYCAVTQDRTRKTASHCSSSGQYRDSASTGINQVWHMYTYIIPSWTYELCKSLKFSFHRLTLFTKIPATPQSF